MYGLPQSGRLANYQIRILLEKSGYYKMSTTPGLWCHKWRPIMFCLILNDFGIQYVRKYHANHLASVLRKYHDITVDW